MSETKKQSYYQEVLKIPSFRNLWFGQIASNLANNSLIFVLSLRLYEITGSNTAVSGLFFMYAVPSLFLGVIAGTLVDKLNKRKVLLMCDLGRALLVGLLLFVPISVASAYIIIILNAILSQFYVPSEAPLIPIFVKKELLLTANSLFSFTYFSSLAVGSIFAGPMLRIFGGKGVDFLLTALFFLAAYFVSRIPQGEGSVISWVRIKSLSIPYMLGRIFSQFTDGIKYASGNKKLIDAIILLTGTQVIIAILGTLGPGFADKVLKIDVYDASVIISAPVVIGIILGALWVGSMGSKNSPTLLINRGVMGAGLMLLVISSMVGVVNIVEPSGTLGHLLLPITLSLFFLLGISNALLDVPANSMLQRESDGPFRSRVYGILTSMVAGVGVIPVIVGGFLADAIGVGKVIFSLGLLITCYGVFRFMDVRRIS